MNTESYPRTTMESCSRNSTAAEDMGGSLSMSYGIMTMPIGCCDDAEKIDNFVSDIYLWPFQQVLKKLVSDTCYINY